MQTRSTATGQAVDKNKPALNGLSILLQPPDKLCTDRRLCNFAKTKLLIAAISWEACSPEFNPPRRSQRKNNVTAEIEKLLNGRNVVVNLCPNRANVDAATAVYAQFIDYTGAVNFYLDGLNRAFTNTFITVTAICFARKYRLAGSSLPSPIFENMIENLDNRLRRHSFESLLVHYDYRSSLASVRAQATPELKHLLQAISFEIVTYYWTHCCCYHGCNRHCPCT